MFGLGQPTDGGRKPPQHSRLEWTLHVDDVPYRRVPSYASVLEQTVINLLKQHLPVRSSGFRTDSTAPHDFIGWIRLSHLVFPSDAGDFSCGMHAA